MLIGLYALSCCLNTDEFDAFFVEEGVKQTHSIAATYVAVTDAQALEGFRLLCHTEGIIPALEPAHAIYYAAKMAANLPQNQLIVINLSGRGDKDLDIVAKAIGMNL